MSESSVSKAARKNQKRAEKRAQQRAQKLRDDGVIDRLLHENEDPVDKLKMQLQEAKDNKDHKLAAKLRKELWVMQDKLAGLMPEEHVDVSQASEEQEEKKDLDANVNNDSPSAQTTEKKLRNLKKKLQQIQNLKEKQEAGEELEDLQIEKIQIEETILAEISELQLGTVDNTT